MRVLNDSISSRITPTMIETRFVAIVLEELHRGSRSVGIDIVANR